MITTEVTAMSSGTPERVGLLDSEIQRGLSDKTEGGGKSCV